MSLSSPCHLLLILASHFSLHSRCIGSSSVESLTLGADTAVSLITRVCYLYPFSHIPKSNHNQRISSIDSKMLHMVTSHAPQFTIGAAFLIIDVHMFVHCNSLTVASLLLSYDSSWTYNYTSWRPSSCASSSCSYSHLSTRRCNLSCCLGIIVPNPYSHRDKLTNAAGRFCLRFDYHLKLMYYSSTSTSISSNHSIPFDVPYSHDVTQWPAILITVYLILCAPY